MYKKVNQDKYVLAEIAQNAKKVDYEFEVEALADFQYNSKRDKQEFENGADLVKDISLSDALDGMKPKQFTTDRLQYIGLQKNDKEVI